MNVLPGPGKYHAGSGPSGPGTSTSWTGIPNAVSGSLRKYDLSSAASCPTVRSRSACHGQRACDYAPGHRCHSAQVPDAARPGNTTEHRLEQGRLVADGSQLDLLGRHACELHVVVRRHRRARPDRQGLRADPFGQVPAAAEEGRSDQTHPTWDHGPRQLPQVPQLFLHRGDRTSIRVDQVAWRPLPASARSAADAWTGHAVIQPSPRSSTPLTPPDGQQGIQGLDRPGSKNIATRWRAVAARPTPSEKIMQAWQRSRRD